MPSPPRFDEYLLKLRAHTGSDSKVAHHDVRGGHPLCLLQRPNKQTGQVEDQYLYSVKVPRRLWREIDFGNLDDVDAVAAFERFEMRRSISKTGVFQPVDPLAA
jgi:hypothetical protein